MSSTAQTGVSGASNFMLGASISGGLSISGLGWDGTDFTTMIDGLRKIEMIPTNRMLKWKADWRERQEAFKVVREQLQALRDVASKMSTMDKFMVKGTTSSKSDVATATAGANAIDNSYRLEVDQIATTSIWSLSNTYYDKNEKINATSSNQTFSYEYAGKVRTLTIPPNATLENFKNLINNDNQNPGIRASIITGSNGVTLQIKGMDQGEKNRLTVIGNGTLVGFPPVSNYGSTSMEFKTDCDNGTDKINESSKEQFFTYTYKGDKRSVSVPANTTLDGLKTAIQTDIGAAGAQFANLSVDLVKNASTGKMELKFITTDAAEPIILSKNSGLPKLGSPSAIQNTSTTYNTGLTSLTGAGGVINNTGSAVTFTYSANGVSKNVTINNGGTLQDLITAVNGNLPTGMSPVTATQNASGEYELNFSGSDVKVDAASKGMLGTELATEPVDPAGWHVQHSQNARIRVDGFPAGSWMDVDSNTVQDVVEGVTFNLVDTGTAIISVNTDAQAIEDNVVEFIEAVNAFRKTVNELTKYDENKQTYDVNYAESLYEMQKGSILTGNYGIQLLSSQLKQATVGGAKGFMPQTKNGDLVFGDLYTSLSQMGIKTNANGDGGDLFGMLMLNDDPDLPMLQDVLAKNPQAVAEFFAAVNKGVSDSPNFSFGSSIQTITRPGSYDVSYEIDSSGNILNAYINGKKADINQADGKFGIYRKGPVIADADKGKVSASFDGQSDFEVDLTCTVLAQNASTKIGTNITGNDKANKQFLTDNGTVTFEVDGNSHSVDISQTDSLELIAKKITRMVDNPGVRGELVKESDGSYSLQVVSRTDGAGGKPVTNLAIKDSTDAPMAFNNGVTLEPSNNGTAVGNDAVYDLKIYNPDGTVKQTLTGQTSKTNNFTNKALSGVTFDVKDTGTFRISAEKYNDADGLEVQVDNIAQSPVGQPYTGSLRIKQGKIPELLELMNGTPLHPEEGMLGSKGAIQILLDNYDKIVAGIDDKIAKETDRLVKWERTTKMRFSRLEATLKQYEGLNKAIESQVKQLSSK